MALPVSRRLDFTEIAVIDLSTLVAGDIDTTTIDALGAACRDVGFVYISGHGVDSALLDDVVAAAREFFARPDAEKAAVLANERMRGYLPLRYTSYEGEDAEATSNQEGFWMGTDRPIDPMNPLDGPNVWPPRSGGLQDAMETYYEAARTLSGVLARAFSLALGRDADFLAELLTPTQALLKVNHYPPQANPTTISDIGVVPHADEGAFTLLWQDEHSGLEVETKSGEWVQAPPIPGTFVVNIGNALQLWTDGEFSSTPHRVINRSGADRYSIPFFNYPRFDAPMTPLVDGVGADPGAGRCGELLMRHWRRTFPVTQTTDPG